jgi:DNA-binding MurR/RpiR family transcriptional regulator
MTIQDAVEAASASLSEADTQVVSFMLGNREHVAMLSAQELASHTGVHAATVVRLAKKLGFEGYPDLRRQLRAELLQPATPDKRIRNQLARASEQSILETLIQRESALIAGIARHVQQAQIDQAARMLIRAERIFVHASGNATVLVELMTRRLRRSGYDVIAVTGDARDLAEASLRMRKTDALLTIVLRRPTRAYTALLNHVAATGAQSVLISDALSWTIVPRPTLALCAPRGDENEFQTLAVPMAICNALVLTLARLDDGRTMQSLRRLVDLTADFENATLSHKQSPT